MPNIWSTAQSYGNYLSSFWTSNGANSNEPNPQRDEEKNPKPVGISPAWVINKLSTGLRYAKKNPVTTLVYVLATQMVMVSAQTDPNPADVPITSDPIHNTLLANFPTVDNALDMIVSGDYAYVAARNAGLRIVNITDPAAPFEVGFFDTPSQAFGISDFGNNQIGVANGAAGFIIFDTTNPSLPLELSTTDTPGFALKSQVIGNFTYIADQFSGMQILNTANPASPFVVGSFLTPDQARDISVLEYPGGLTVAFIAARSAGLIIVDVSDPANPIQLGSITWPSASAEGVEVINGVAYVADGNNGMRVVDVNNLANPVLAQTIDTLGFAQDVTISNDGNQLFLADGATGVQIYDTSEPLNPVRIGGHFTGNGAVDVQVQDNILVISNSGSGGQTAQIGFTPQLTANQLSIIQGQSLPLNLDNLNGIDQDSPIQDLVFIASNVQGGTFFNSESNSEVSSFTLAQIQSGVVAFIHDGSTVAPSFEISISDNVARTVPQSAQISFTLDQDDPSNSSNNSSTDNGIIIGAIFGTALCLACLAVGVASTIGYKKYQKKLNDSKALELELGERESSLFLDTEIQESATRRANRYQVLNQYIPESYKKTYKEQTGLELTKEPLGRGNFAETWPVLDEKAPKGSSFQFLAGKVITKNINKSFAEKLREAETQRSLNGVDLYLHDNQQACDILNTNFLSNDEKKNKLELKPNCFYLLPKSKSNKKNQIKYQLAYLDPNGEIKHKPVSDKNELTKWLYLQLQKLSNSGIEAIFHKEKCTFLFELNINFDNIEQQKKYLNQELPPLTYFVSRDIENPENWSVFYKHPNGELQQKDISHEAALLKALNETNEQILGELFSEFHLKEYHYEKNRLLRLITNQIPFESFINLDNGIMPVLDYFIQKDGLYILTILAPRNGEDVKKLLADPNLDPALRNKLLKLIAHDSMVPVSYLHSINFVHNDLKSDNYVFLPNGKILLIDFGEGRKCPNDLNNKSVLSESYHRGHFVGTPPEAFFRNNKVSFLNQSNKYRLEDIHSYYFSKDAWAMGITLLVYLTGKSNPLAHAEDYENPKNYDEWLKACEGMRKNGTLEHFEKKLESVYSAIKEQSFIALLKNLLVVRLENSNKRNLTQVIKDLESDPELTNAEENRTDLFNELWSVKISKPEIIKYVEKSEHLYNNSDQHVTYLNNDNKMDPNNSHYFGNNRNSFLSDKTSKNVTITADDSQKGEVDNAPVYMTEENPITYNA